MRRRLITRLRDDRGAAALEFAFVLPVLFLIAAGLIDFGRAIWTQTTLDYGVQAAARCGALQFSSADNTLTCYSNKGADTSHIKAYAVTQTYGLPVVTGDFTVTSTTTDCSGNTSPVGLKVSVTYAFTYFFPALRSDSGNFGACAHYPT